MRQCAAPCPREDTNVSGEKRDRERLRHSEALKKGRVLSQPEAESQQDKSMDRSPGQQ